MVNQKGWSKYYKNFRGNKDGRWEQIWVMAESFMQTGSIINGNGKQIQSWDIKISCKVIIEAVIKRPVIVLSR